MIGQNFIVLRFWGSSFISVHFASWVLRPVPPPLPAPPLWLPSRRKGQTTEHPKSLLPSRCFESLGCSRRAQVPSSAPILRISSLREGQPAFLYPINRDKSQWARRCATPKSPHGRVAKGEELRKGSRSLRGGRSPRPEEPDTRFLNAEPPGSGKAMLAVLDCLGYDRVCRADGAGQHSGNISE
jgi:hypothetical protein